MRLARRRRHACWWQRSTNYVVSVWFSRKADISRTISSLPTVAARAECVRTGADVAPGTTSVRKVSLEMGFSSPSCVFGFCSCFRSSIMETVTKPKLEMVIGGTHSQFKIQPVAQPVCTSLDILRCQQRFVIICCHRFRLSRRRLAHRRRRPDVGRAAATLLRRGDQQAS